MWHAGNDCSRADHSTGPGCGSRWLVEATYKLSTKSVTDIDPVPQISAFKYWAGADALAADTSASLTNTQAIAAKWHQSVTAILGLLAIASLIGGRDGVQKLSRDWQRGLAATVTVSLVASAGAFALFALASSGVPRLRLTAGPRALLDADLKPLRLARRAALYFRLTIALAFGSLLCALAAIFIVWFSKPSSTPKDVDLTSGGGSRLDQWLLLIDHCPTRPAFALHRAACAAYRAGMSNAWGGPPGRAAWYAQQNPDGKSVDADEQERAARDEAARSEWGETHPNLLRRLLTRLRRR